MGERFSLALCMHTRAEEGWGMWLKLCFTTTCSLPTRHWHLTWADAS